MSINALNANWNYPTSIQVGAGRIHELPTACTSLKMKAPLLVTDPGLARLPITEQVLQHCKTSHVDVSLFTNIKANPTGENIVDGVKAYHDGSHDGVIAFGGGSALDAGKAIALMAGQTRPLWDFEDIGDNWKRIHPDGIAPVIAIPTTAGTGSEVGRASVITDPEEKKKKIIFHPKMLPQLVILDPGLTISLPPHLTAATGMDALSHCLEAFCTTYYHPMAEGIALEGIRLVKDYLPRAVHDGNDVNARTQMLVASSMGATAFQRGLGAMHALAHPLGALYDAHHGRLNAILMPYVLLANRPAIEEKISRLAVFLQLSNGFDGFLDWIISLRRELTIEHTLLAIGIDEQHLPTIAKMAMEDAAASGNPILFNKEQYQDLLAAAIQGKL